MKQRVLNAAILTALGLGAAGMAQGQQVLDENELTEDAPTYARQIPNDTTLTLPAGDDVIQFPLGFGLSNGDERFIRLDVLNGEFDGAPTVSEFSCSTVGGGTTACGFAIGSTGTNFVVVGISATTTNLAPTQRVDVDLGSIVAAITDEDDPVEIRFRLYEDPVQANTPGGGSATLNDITDEVAIFADGLFVTSSGTGTTASAGTASWARHRWAITAPPASATVTGRRSCPSCAGPATRARSTSRAGTTRSTAMCWR